jgi:pimeloyl-ACP methyl ester carboxylesterase
MFDSLSLQYFLADAVVQHDVPPFAIASIDGGESTYWHPRSNGDNPLAMVTDEYLPQLAERGLLVDQFGLWGWSMGGYGALLLASALGPKRVSAVVASSPALSRTAAETAPGAFDDATDFERNNIFTRETDLQGIPLRIDIGDNDSFTPMVEQFRDELATTPDGGVTRGSHDSAYWMRVAPAEIEFLGTHLAL